MTGGDGLAMTRGRLCQEHEGRSSPVDQPIGILFNRRELIILVVVVAGIPLSYSYQHCTESFGAGQVSERHEEEEGY